jgi:hypothetical protein
MADFQTKQKRKENAHRDFLEICGDEFHSISWDNCGKYLSSKYIE